MKKTYKEKGSLLSSDAAAPDNRKDSSWDNDEEEDTESDLLWNCSSNNIVSFYLLVYGSVL